MYKPVHGEEPVVLEDRVCMDLATRTLGASLERAVTKLTVSTSLAEEEEAVEDFGRSGTSSPERSEAEGAEAQLTAGTGLATEGEVAEHFRRSGASSPAADDAKGGPVAGSKAVNKELAKMKLKRLQATYNKRGEQSRV